jgi:hypothetical protein
MLSCFSLILERWFKGDNQQMHETSTVESIFGGGGGNLIFIIIGLFFILKLVYGWKQIETF